MKTITVMITIKRLDKTEDATNKKGENKEMWKRR